MVDKSNNHQWLLKPLGERLIGNFIINGLGWQYLLPIVLAYYLCHNKYHKLGNSLPKFNQLKQLSLSKFNILSRRYKVLVSLTDFSLQILENQNKGVNHSELFQGGSEKNLLPTYLGGWQKKKFPAGYQLSIVLHSSRLQFTISY